MRPLRTRGVRLGACLPALAIVIGIPEPIETIDVGLVDEWRMNGTVTDANGSALRPQGDSVLLVSTDGEDYRNVAVDENGTFADYVPSGDWIAVIGAFEGEDATEILRQALTVSENSARTPTCPWPPLRRPM